MSALDEEWEKYQLASNEGGGHSDDDADYDCADTHDNVPPVGDVAAVQEDREGRRSRHFSAFAEQDKDLTRLLPTGAPAATPIYISTKTKIAYLNRAIDLAPVFWRIPVLPYATPAAGVIKKQIKFNTLSRADYEVVQSRLRHEPCCEQHVIAHIDNPAGRIVFKDTRKVSIGVSKKDLLSCRSKKKSAFYNCFVLILRLRLFAAAPFREFHVKVFNTGKLEIPGVQDECAFDCILRQIVVILGQHICGADPISLQKEEGAQHPLAFVPGSTQTVLINSNFNCGFFIDRHALFQILKFKYNIDCHYDPCSYPGIQCKFHYDPSAAAAQQTGCNTVVGSATKGATAGATAGRKSGCKVSFMIFRTGSVLIVGKCNDSVILEIYRSPAALSVAAAAPNSGKAARAARF